jgi:hypothetical protein
MTGSSRPTGAISAASNAKSLIAARISNNIVANAGFATGFQYGGIGTRAGLTFAWQRATNLRPVSPV